MSLAFDKIQKTRSILNFTSLKEIQQLESAQDGDAIFNIASEAVNRYFQQPANSKRHVAVLMLDTKGDLRVNGLINRSAMSDGVGVCGIRSLYTFPSCIEEVVPAVSYTRDYMVSVKKKLTKVNISLRTAHVSAVVLQAQTNLLILEAFGKL